MPLDIGTLVVETTSTELTGPYELNGAVDGRTTFRSQVADGGLAPYVVSDGVQSEWGLGTLTYGTPDTLARTTIQGNTAGTLAPVNWGSGGKTVWLSPHANQLIMGDESGEMQGPLGVTATGSIAQRNLKDRFGDVANIFDFGAICDGTAHPLSERYDTLLEAQAAYPTLTDLLLTDEIDWAAWQASCDTAGVNGMILAPAVPAGQYSRCNRPVAFQSGQRICGLGLHAFRTVGAIAGFVAKTQTTASTNRAYFEALEIYNENQVGGGVHAANQNAIGIDLRECFYSTVRNCVFRGHGRGVRLGVREVAVVSVTRSGTVATATTSEPHGFVTGTLVTVEGVFPRQYAIRWEVITVTGANTFTYSVPGSPATPATLSGLSVAYPLILGGFYNHLEQIEVANAEVGFDFGRFANANTMLNCRASSCKDGIRGNRFATLSAHGCTFESNRRAGVWLGGFTTGHAFHGGHYEGNNRLFALSSVSWAASEMTLVATTQHFLAAGDKIRVEGLYPIVYTGVFAPTSIPDGTSVKVSVPTLSIGAGALTRAGATATLSLPGHRVQVGDPFILQGFDQAEYNGTFTATAVVNGNVTQTISFAVSGTPASPATGTGVFTYESPVAESTFAVSSITSDGSGTATVTALRHAMSTGNTWSVRQVTQAEYNVENAVITRIDADTFTYPISGAPASPATLTSARYYRATAFPGATGFRYQAGGAIVQEAPPRTACTTGGVTQISGTLIQIEAPGHGIQPAQVGIAVRIRGATQPEFNIITRIEEVIDGDRITARTHTTPSVATATGTITLQIWRTPHSAVFGGSFSNAEDRILDFGIGSMLILAAGAGIAPATGSGAKNYAPNPIMARDSNADGVADGIRYTTTTGATRSLDTTDGFFVSGTQSQKTAIAVTGSNPRSDRWDITGLTPNIEHHWALRLHTDFARKAAVIAVGPIAGSTQYSSQALQDYGDFVVYSGRFVPTDDKAFILITHTNDFAWPKAAGVSMWCDAIQVGVGPFIGMVGVSEPANANHPGVVKDLYYRPLGVGALTTVAAVADTIYACLVRVVPGTTYTRMVAECTAGATGSLRIGLYKNLNGQPGALVLDSGSIAVTAAVLSSTVTFIPDEELYWLSVLFSAAPTMRAAQPNAAIVTPLLGAATTTADREHYTKAHAFAALPDPFGTPTAGAGAAVPIAFLRVV